MEPQVIKFQRFHDFYIEAPGAGFYEKAETFLQDLIATYQPQSILEIGAGANPTLSVDYVRAAPFTYTTNDVSEGELRKADQAYQRLCLDVCYDLIPDHALSAYDLIFSRMVNEHVRDGRTYYTHIFHMLSPGGITVHCFPTLYALPFVTNRIMPECISDHLLGLMAPRDRYQHAKFKAYYSWSRGPSSRMIRKFEAIGYQVVEYVGFFGHNYYRRFPLLHKLERFKSIFLCSHLQIAALTSYAYVILRKPDA
jgi:2-polyprenyl-3-methyl-5-hydroxy-6-metoxy-1,4-benzoquinol methylase